MTNTWTTVATFSSPQEAAIVRGMLLSEDIPVEMTNQTISSVYPMTDTWAPVELKVPATMAEKARRLMDLHGDAADE